MRGLALALSGCTLSQACLNPSQPWVPCEGDWGENPPVACALLAAHALGVEPGDWINVPVPQAVEPGESWYMSHPAPVAASGDFVLVVLCYGNGGPIDTATVTLGAFTSPDSAMVPGSIPHATAQVRLTFAPIGRRVDSTYADGLGFH